jgi:hypothetical protein
VAYRAKPLVYRAVTAAICQRSPQPLCELPLSANYHPSSGKIRRIWRTSFCIDGSVTLLTGALRRPIFKQKKGSAIISLGLNYCSMGSSQSPCRDTVTAFICTKICLSQSSWLISELKLCRFISAAM